MSERIKLFQKYLISGTIYPCDVFTHLVIECPEQVLHSIRDVKSSVSLEDRVLCNCMASTPIDCDCLPMPLLNHFVYIISSFGKHFQLAKQIIEALIERGCDVNRVDEDIGSVLHALICCLDNDIKMNVNESEYEISVQCLDYLLSLNECDLDLDVGYRKASNARGTPLALAIDRQLVFVARKLISVGASVTKTTLNPCLIPEVLNEKQIQIFDLLFEAGLDLDSDLRANDREVVAKQGLCVDEWIRAKKSVPKSLKNMARIVLRESLNKSLNDQNLNNSLSIPQSLIIFLKFE